jgi:hypothetical protein
MGLLSQRQEPINLTRNILMPYDRKGLYDACCTRMDHMATPCSSHSYSSWYGAERVWPWLQTRSDFRSVDLTFAVPKSRFVEFVAKPTRQ